MNRLKEIEVRLKQIMGLLEQDDADFQALKMEADALMEERASLLKVEEFRKELLNKVSNGAGEIVQQFVESVESKRKLGKRTEMDEDPMYRTAWLKTLLNYELTAEERAAYTHTTENTGAVVPKQLLDRIYSTMEEKHPILADIQTLRTGAVISISKHTAIVKGDAKAVAEGAANDDEQNTFVEVTLSGKDYSKTVKFSYRLGKMAIPAFQSYLEKELGDRIGAAMAKDVVAQIKTDLHADNKMTPAVATKVVKAEWLKAFGKLKKVGNVNIYANNATIYGIIAAIEGDQSTLSFVSNYQEQVSGHLLGRAIKEEDALANGEILILDPDQYLQNVVQDIMIERDNDIENHKHIISAFAIAGGTLTNDKAGVLITASVGA